jgi:protein tyrosine/serine phosphatase
VTPAASPAQRHLDWPGCFNVRDLGGLPAAGGSLTVRGALVRADSLNRLTDEGWQALLDHGVRTVVDLRTADERERGGDVASRPAEVTTVHVALDDSADPGISSAWERGPQFATPLYYRAHLQRKPQLSAAVLARIAAADPGGVAFHCVAGRDRSGQVAMVALALLGVPEREIAADYTLSAERLPRLFAAAGIQDQGPQIEAFLAERGTSAGEIIAATLSSLDIEALMRQGGLGERELAALRARLLEPAQ